MKALFRLFSLIHALIAVMFFGIALLIMGIAAQTIWHSLSAGLDREAANGIIEAIGLIAVAVVALQIAQTIVEEEVIRDVNVSAPTRVRRYLSRFMVVIVVALAIEGLVATFKALHEDMTQLPYAASILVAVAVLVAGWGVFIHLNRSAEELEPEAMKEAKEEDHKLD
jgi:signal transduction histidine kinase